MTTLDYCTNEDVLKLMPQAARDSDIIDTEIDTWRPVAQSLLDDMFSDKYITPLEGKTTELTTETMPSNVRYATALMTVSLLFVNAFSEYNFEEQQGEKTISLSQLKESQAKKLISKFIDKKNGYFHPLLKQTSKNNIIPRALKVFESDNQTNTSDFISEVNGFYS